MITRDWKQYKGNPIWKMKQYTEDFVVIQNPKDKKYYAFFTYGEERNQKLGLALSKSPLGPFKEYKINPVFNQNMRIGSVISPCKLTNNKWRLYYCARQEEDWKKGRTINFIESDDLIKWSKDTKTNIETELFEDENVDFFGQPFCQIIDNEFYILVSASIKEGLFIYNYFSKDGINFYVREHNPLISPKPNTKYSLKIANPTFIYENDEINIFCEGNEGPGWDIFQFVLKKLKKIKSFDKPLFPPITANPYITKFNNKYYLYYGELINAGKEDYHYEVNVAYQDAI